MEAHDVMPVFEVVQLFTESGAPVAKVTIPKFVKRPIVLTWGQRTFLLKNRHSYEENRYCETFNYYVAPIPGVDDNGLTE